MQALVTGATGLVGQALLPHLTRSTILTRDPSQVARNTGKGKAPPVNALAWDPQAGPPAPEAFAETAVVFHLAGEPVAQGRWTAAKKQRIRQSRVQGTRHLVQGLAQLAAPPRVLVSASAVGFYGDRGEEELDETSSAHQTFLAEVCQAWEQEALQAERLGVRVVTARLGIVLAPGGGALQRMLPPFRLGLGGYLGTGRQWMPWIHLDDVVGLLLHAAQNSAISGPLNVVSPRPVRNQTFTQQLSRILNRPAVLPVPRTVLRLAFGELATVLLASQRVLPKVAEHTGYTFTYRELDPALSDCLQDNPR